jgi:3-oxoadipate enol-lactonase
MPVADLGDVRLHYRFDGDETAPVLVLSHSLGANLSMWDKVTPALAGRYRVLRYDMRGHGLSSVPSDACTISDLAGDLLRLLDRLDLGRVHLCGLSLGGVIGMWTAAQAPHRLNRLVLANTAARIGTRESWQSRIAQVRSDGMIPLAPSTMTRWFTPEYREQFPAEIEAARAMVAACPPDGYIAGCTVLRDTDLRPALASISTPSLVIAGAFDPSTPPADGRDLHAAIRGSRYVELPCSHLSAWERPQEFQQAILDFLAPQETSHG